MVYKKYIKKKGKLHGPYYYKSYRENGKIKHKYLGTSDPYRRKLVTAQVILLFFVFLIIFNFAYLGITGKSIIEEMGDVAESVIDAVSENVSEEINETEEDSGGNESEGVVITQNDSNVSDSDEVMVNETLVTNETVLGENVSIESNKTVEGNFTGVNETVVEEDVSLDVITIREKIVVGKPVKWLKNVSLDKPGRVKIELPKEAEDIKVEKVVDNVEISITGSVVIEDVGGFSLVEWLKGLFRFTGFVVQEEDLGEYVEVVIDENSTEYIIEFYTPGPEAVESEKEFGKEVVVSGPEGLNYTDVLAFTEIPESFGIGKDMRIYWVEENKEIDFEAYDLNENGLIDYVEWNVEHLSEQTFNIILITNAEHLDENRIFVEDVYDLVRERDDVWTESIPDGHYIRVRFERNLTSEKDITIYARSSSSGNVEVYEFGKEDLIADFGVINEDKEYKIYLDNLVGEQSIFDLKVLGEVEFDYIVDPEGDEYTTGWNKTIDGGNIDKLYSVAIDSGDNVYFVGTGRNKVSGASSDDWWIKQFNSSGTENVTNWNKTITGHGDIPTDVAYSVAIDSNDNIYVVGTGWDLVSGTSTNDWWIKQFNSSGTENVTNWNKTIDNKGADIAYSVAVDSNNNVYVAGTGGGFNWWIKQFNSTGAENVSNWNKTYDFGGNDYARSIAVDSNNDIYIAGMGQNLVTATSNLDWMIKKFNSTGSEDVDNWNKTFDCGAIDNLYSVAVDSNDNVYAAGTTGNDWWIKKFNSSGTEDINNWNKTFYRGIAYSIAVDSSDNVYFGGQLTNTNWHIKKFISDGTQDVISWNKTFSLGTDDYIYSIAVDSGDNVYAAGVRGNDWHIKKFDAGEAPPVVNVISPIATTYSGSSTVGIQLDINKTGYCEYSLDSGATNVTLTANSSDTSFTATTSFSNASYTLTAYCNDTFGYKNYTTSVDFIIAVPGPEPEETVGSPPSSGGGGDSGSEDAPSESTCTSSWSCSDWGDCVSGTSTRSCLDLNDCGTDLGKPEEYQTCESVSEVCVPELQCEEWGECSYLGSVEQIFNGTISSSGVRTRTCVDFNGCLDGYVEEEECSSTTEIISEGDAPLSGETHGDEEADIPEELEVEVFVAPSGGSGSIIVRNVITGNPTSVIDMGSLVKGMLDVSFVQSEDIYPEHCFNAFLDEDETGVDCGGSCIYCGMAGVYFSLVPWIVLVVLVFALASGILVNSLESLRRRKIVKLMDLGSDVLTSAELTGSHDNLKDAVEHYQLMREHYSKLSKKSQGIVMDGIMEYHNDLDKEIKKRNEETQREIGKDKEKKIKKFVSKFRKKL